MELTVWAANPTCSLMRLTLLQTVMTKPKSMQLLQVSKIYEEGVVLITLGPLTNVALACKIDNQFCNRFQKVVVMGGSESAGNITSCAEYNFHADPEAAHCCYFKIQKHYPFNVGLLSSTLLSK
eukprot:TRINITY_DN1775_c0_g1_i2.p4 TRINITY_DN1775_c0_g1~~TRINITY_DN1775_c0_g1_i2.p4  ORF type:complete len:124 (+),score=12.32 TRINITY_DN1775_c0_g1_i2:77-448(+)